MDRLETVKTLIGKGQTKSAIKALDDLIVSTQFRDELTIISSRLEELEKSVRLGLINDETRIIQMNKINHSLIILIQKINERLNSNSKNIESYQKSRISIFPLFFILIGMGIFIVFFNLSNSDKRTLVDTSKLDIKELENDANNIEKPQTIDYSLLEARAIEELLSDKYSISLAFDSIIKFKKFDLGLKILDAAKSKTIQKDKIIWFDYRKQGLIFSRDYNYDDAYLDFPAKEKIVEVEKNGKLGLCSKNGNVIINPLFDEFDPIIYKPLILTKLNEKFGFLNSIGREIIPPILDETEEFSREGDILIKERDKYGVLNRLGKIVIPVSYDILNEPDDKGFIRVKSSYTWGYINKFGKKLIPFDYDTLGLFENNIAFAKKDDENVKYIDRYGRIVKNPHIR